MKLLHGWFIPTFVVLCAELARAADPTSIAVVTPGHLYDRIAVVGASVSDGFGVFVAPAPSTAGAGAASPSSPAGVPTKVDLSDALRAAVPTSPGPIVHHYASGFFFSNPGPVGTSEIDRALAVKPTLVLALDFLFWYAYGTVGADGEVMQSQQERTTNLEVGLRQLDRVLSAGIPLIIGDIPDMSDAIGKMLSANQVPDRATLEAVNARITAWVASRPSVRLMQLRTLLASLKTGGTIEVAGRVWDPAQLGSLLQRDQLHPTFPGTLILAAGLIDLARTYDTSSPPPFAFEVEPVATRARDNKQLKSAKRPQTANAPTPR